jgi:hypothetical protein
MTQTDLCFEPSVKVPPHGSMTYELLMALKMGERLTPLSALERFKCFSLSQRMGELRRSGWPIVSQMISLPSGKKVAEYRMGQEQVAA